jgi:hypothetical protein
MCLIPKSTWETGATKTSYFRVLTQIPKADQESKQNKESWMCHAEGWRSA